MKIVIILCALLAVSLAGEVATNPTQPVGPPLSAAPGSLATVKTTGSTLTPCICGVFLTGQFTKGGPVRGNPVLMHEHDDHTQCNAVGQKQCMNKCLDVLVKHLSKSPTIICGAMDRDCHKERAYLFTKNCQDKWVNTNLSAGREYCCKNGAPYKCPIG